VCHGCGAMARNALGGRGLASGFLIVGVALCYLGPSVLGLVLGGLALFLALMAFVLTAKRMKLVAPGPFCRHCQYDLSALEPAARCPERGTRQGPPLF